MSLREYLKNIADTLRNWLNSGELINAQNFPEAINSACETQYANGSNDGYVYGYDEGYWVGEEVGYSDGYNEGHEEGYIEGYHQGEAEGYNKGGLDASPQETVSGEAISIKDVSPIEHNIRVSVRGVEDISTVKLYKQGKNLIQFPSVNSSYNINYKAGVEKTTAGITFTVNDDGSVYVRGTATNSAFFNLCKRDLKINYNNAIEGGENGTTNKTANLSVSKRTAYQQSNQLMYLHIPKGVTIDEVLYPQVEYGSRTEYEPYIEPTVYDVSADGTVEGVTSLYPSTTLYTDTSGAVIDCTYYQDGKKVKENLTDMILSLGGVINE